MSVTKRLGFLKIFWAEIVFSEIECVLHIAVDAALQREMDRSTRIYNRVLKDGQTELPDLDGTAAGRYASGHKFMARARGHSEDKRQKRYPTRNNVSLPGLGVHVGSPPLELRKLQIYPLPGISLALLWLSRLLRLMLVLPCSPYPGCLLPV
jgi:hypothetical protein